MTKAKKIISIIVCLLALTVMVPIMIEYHNVRLLTKRPKYQ